jgi:hypothetical protein
MRAGEGVERVAGQADVGREVERRGGTAGEQDVELRGQRVGHRAVRVHLDHGADVELLVKEDDAALTGVRWRGEAVALLDAKYRDLWERELPRNMLYQLSVYALSQPRGSTAAILYPSTASEAREAVTEIRDPVVGRSQGFVALRPVLLSRLAGAIHEATEREARQVAAELAFGYGHSVQRRGRGEVVRRSRYRRASAYVVWRAGHLAGVD